MILSPLLIGPLLVGLGLTLGVLLGGLLLRAWTAPRLCPDCGAPTARITRPLWAPAWIERRWCGHCGWEGSGRNGPDFDPDRGPSDHGSGFRWSRARRRGALFLWRPRPGGRVEDELPEPPTPPHPQLAFEWGEPSAPGFHFREPGEGQAAGE